MLRAYSFRRVVREFERIYLEVLGVVGTVTAACLAETGHEVAGIEPMTAKVDALLAGHYGAFHRSVRKSRRSARTDFIPAKWSRHRLLRPLPADEELLAHWNLHGKKTFVYIGTHAC
jgi:hypothetical protein